MRLITDRLRLAKRPGWILLAVLAVAAAMAVQGPTPALAYTDFLDIECNENPVSEGDTYRLHIVKSGGVSGQAISVRTETMKVYWTTESDTADHSDYSPLHREGQASNGFQSWNGRMGRTFYTTEDDLSELTEQFTVKAENAADGGTVVGENGAYDDTTGECGIEITDDDGPGSYDTRIIAYPDSGTYKRGDFIDFSVHFTHEVLVTGGTPTLGLHVGEGTGDEPNRYATLQPGSGHLTPFQFGYYTLFFRYQVGPDDLDPDGISVPSGEFGGTGKITRRWNDGDLNQKYHGVVGGSQRKVLGQTHVTNVSMASTPKHGNTYRRGENIEVKVRFSHPVQVNGSVYLRLKVGDGPGFLKQAPYHRGSGTDTLVFRYPVNAVDLDTTGITVAPGISDSGEPTGILGSGSIVFVQGDNEHPVHLAYDALIDRPHHKVDGRAYVKRVAITSEPDDGDHYTAGEAILVGVTFDRTVSIEPKPAITIEVGEHEKRAQYHRGSFSKTLVFRYEVDEEDVDLDGISVPQQDGFRGSGHVWEADTRFGVNERIPKLAHQSAHRVNGVLPTVVASEIVSEPASGDVYRFGETIEIALEFDEEVDVVGQPSITILLDDSTNPERSAVYSRGSGTDTLVFAYTVQTADLDLDGVALPERDQDGFGPTTAHVYQAGTENAVTGHIVGFDDAIGHQVDGRPLVTAAAVTSTPARGGVYRAGETVSISLTYDRPVVVEGTPSVALEIGDHHAEATYRGGSGTNTIEFGYEVQVHDLDVDGFALPAADGQSFHDGTVYSAGREIELVATYPGFVSQEAHRIAGQVYVTEVSMGSDPGDDDTYEPGDVIQILISFDDKVTVTGSPQISLDLGGTSVAADFQGIHNPGDGASPSTGEALAFAYTVQVGDEDDDGITVEANSLNLHGGSILDTAGESVLLHHDAETFDGHLVGVVPPVLVGAWTSTDGQEVILTFSENVHVRPDVRTLSSFTGVALSSYPRVLIDIFVDGHRAYTHAPAMSGAEMVIKMDTFIRPGQRVTVSHDDVFARDLPGILVDDDGNALMHFDERVVSNRSTLSEEAQGLLPVLSAYSLTIAEGETGSYSVVLASQPDGDVAVDLSISPSGHLTASAEKLTFTPENWDSPQTVTLTAGTDDDDLNSWQEILHTSDAEGFVVGHLKVLIVAE